MSLSEEGRMPIEGAQSAGRGPSMDATVVCQLRRHPPHFWSAFRNLVREGQARDSRVARAY